MLENRRPEHVAGMGAGRRRRRAANRNKTIHGAWRVSPTNNSTIVRYPSFVTCQEKQDHIARSFFEGYCVLVLKSGEWSAQRVTAAADGFVLKLLARQGSMTDLLPARDLPDFSLCQLGPVSIQPAADKSVGHGQPRRLRREAQFCSPCLDEIPKARASCTTSAENSWVTKIILAVQATFTIWAAVSIFLGDAAIVPVRSFIALWVLPVRELDLLQGYLFPWHYIEQV